MAARTIKSGGTKTVVNRINRLSARGVAALAKPGRHADGGNLYLKVDPSGARRWVFMFVRAGRQREAGLGSAMTVSLKDARERAAELRSSLARGADPLQARAAGQREAKRKKTFGECAEEFIASKESGWRNEKHTAQWRRTLEKYAAPLRSLPVAEVSTQDILHALQPIWLAKPETASRVRGRIEAVLDSARVGGHIDDRAPNPARWGGHLEMLLPPPAKLSRGHHAAMAYADVPKFISKLRLAAENSMGALALEFAILTAARTGEVIGARWSEIDMAAKVWAVPAGRTKAGREHRVPLSRRALALLDEVLKARRSDFVFAGQRGGKPLSNMAMAMAMRRLRIEGLTVHGFRSAFRDWAGEETDFPRELAEAALGHVMGDKAEQAYRRGDSLEKRRALMEAWAVFCESAHS